jgi:serine/threonine-protein kinase
MAIDNFGVPMGTAFQANDNWYKIIQYIGKGANGTVFLVNSTGGKYKGGIFAMKVFHKMSSEKRKERFLTEIKFMKEQHHPSIMRQYDEGVFRGHPFVIMEYIPYTLEREIKKRKGPNTKYGLIYSTQLLSSIKHLHELGKIHRDIKPGNIFVNNSAAILGDFGLIADSAIKDGEDNEDVKGYVAMPKFYRTPELVKYAKNESPLRCESDVFQLGLVLAYVFSGKNPLKASKNLLDNIELDDVIIPNMWYQKRISDIINKMLVLNPDNRISIDMALDGFNGILKDYYQRLTFPIPA